MQLAYGLASVKRTVELIPHCPVFELSGADIADVSVAAFSVFLVAGAGWPSRLTPLSYVGRLCRPRNEPASSQVQVGHTMQIKRPTPCGAGLIHLVAGA